MLNTLTVRQINNLLTGNDLAAEIPASAAQRRAFVVVGAYRDVGQSGGAPVSKFLNADQRDVRFWLRKYEIDTAYLENDWDVVEDDLQESLFLKGLASLEAVERELAKYLDDFANLDVSWRRDNPL